MDFYDYANRLTELITAVRDTELENYWHRAHGIVCRFADGTQFFVASSGYLFVVDLGSGIELRTTYSDYVNRLITE